MSKKPIDFNKPVQTANGLPVRILCKDMNSDIPVVGIVTNTDGSEWCGLWEADGRHRVGDCWDLQNVTTKKTGWINLYPVNTKRKAIEVSDVVYDTKNCANALSGRGAIQVKIEWEE